MSVQESHVIVHSDIHINSNVPIILCFTKVYFHISNVKVKLCNGMKMKIWRNLLSDGQTYIFIPRGPVSVWANKIYPLVSRRRWKIVNTVYVDTLFTLSSLGSKCQQKSIYLRWSPPHYTSNPVNTLLPSDSLHARHVTTRVRDWGDTCGHAGDKCYCIIFTHSIHRHKCPPQSPPVQRTECENKHWR